MSSIKTAVPKLGGNVDFPLWKRRFEGFALSNDCMHVFTTTVDTPVGDVSVRSQFLIDQGFSETSIRRARIAWTSLTESITDRELSSKVFDTNSPSAGWRFLLNWFVPKTLSEKSKWKRLFNELWMEKKEDPMKFFARVDKIVGVLAALGVNMPVEDLNLKLIQVLTSDYEYEQRTILYRDDITRAEIEAIVRQRYSHISRNDTKNRDVGQALITSKSIRRNRNPGGAKGDKGKKHEGIRNKCHRCSEPGHRWYECNAHVIPAPKKSQEGSGNIIPCLSIGVESSMEGAVGERKSSDDGIERWLADSGASFYMTKSAEFLRDMRPSDDKFKIGSNTLIDVECYGSLTVIFPNKAGGVAVRLEKGSYVPDLVFNLFSL
ncbi:unnamed protein product, partial [Sphacelaria rigidula]